MFTDKEKFEIVTFLGWPAKAIIPGTTDYSKILSDRLDNNPLGVLELARDILAKLRKLDEKREGALCRASTIQVDDIHLNKDELYILTKERLRLLRELSDLLSVPMTGKSTSGGGSISLCV